MAINIYHTNIEDEANAMRDAYGLMARRSNLAQTIQNQIHADEANSRLGFGYDQLEASMAQRELDRNAEMANQEANRDFQVQRDAAGNAADLSRLQAAGEQQRQTFNYELDARQKMRLQQINGRRARLEQQVRDGLWQNRPNELNIARNQLDNEEFETKIPPPPPPQKLPLYEQAKADGRIHEFPGGGMLIMQTDGDLKYEPPPPPPKSTPEMEKAKNDAAAEKEQARKDAAELLKVEAMFMKQAEKEYDAAYAEWSDKESKDRNGNPIDRGPKPTLTPPDPAKIAKYIKDRRAALESLRPAQQTGGSASTSQSSADAMALGGAGVAALAQGSQQAVADAVRELKAIAEKYPDPTKMPEGDVLKAKRLKAFIMTGKMPPEAQPAAPPPVAQAEPQYYGAEPDYVGYGGGV